MKKLKKYKIDKILRYTPYTIQTLKCLVVQKYVISIMPYMALRP